MNREYGLADVALGVKRPQTKTKMRSARIFEIQSQSFCTKLPTVRTVTQTHDDGEGIEGKISSFRVLGLVYLV